MAPGLMWVTPREGFNNVTQEYHRQVLRNGLIGTWSNSLIGGAVGSRLQIAAHRIRSVGGALRIGHRFIMKVWRPETRNSQ
jgi:hypothetical protein